MQWYDLIAGVYDQFSKGSYRKARKALVEKLDLKGNETILHIGCGTGLSFALLKDKLDDDGTLIGIDVSSKMLAQAQKKIRKNNWQNIHLIHLDARQMTLDVLRAHVGRDIIIDHAIGELSFTVMPDWRNVMKNAVSLINPSGKLAVLDGYRPKKDLLNASLNLLPRSDISRPIAEQLRKLTENVYLETFGVSKIIFIAIGTKSAKTDL